MQSLHFFKRSYGSTWERSSSRKLLSNAACTLTFRLVGEPALERTRGSMLNVVLSVSLEDGFEQFSVEAPHLL